MKKNPSYMALLRPTRLSISEKSPTCTIKWSYTIIWQVRVLSLDRGQCYLLWCNFVNNSTQRGQYFVTSDSKSVAYIEISVSYCSVTLKK